MTRHQLHIVVCLAASLLLAAVLLLAACSGSKKVDSLPAGPQPAPDDTLRVGTLYSPTTYFLYRDEPMGYEYEMVRQFADTLGRPLKIVVAENFSVLLDKLDRGEVELLACQIPQTAQYKQKVLHCGVEEVTTQVLVQPRNRKGVKRISDVTELVGKKVAVEKGTKYYSRLLNLNEEIGGGIEIVTPDQDSIITQDLVRMVSDGSLDYTIIDSDIASLESTYYPDLDISLKVSLEQRSSWAVGKGNTQLADEVNRWAAGVATNRAEQPVHRRYFEQAKNSLLSSGDKRDGNVVQVARMLSATAISPYDEIFRKEAARLGWDWRFLAAVAYEESRFNNNVESWAGAKGIMQIMPRTARAHGLSDAEMKDPARSVETAMKIFATLDGIFKSKVKDPAERRKFVLAAYNAGHGHILDAIALARKYGLSPDVWDANVSEALLMKSRPEYYNDPAVKSGYFRGIETVNYVSNVLSTYNYYLSHAPS